MNPLFNFNPGLYRHKDLLREAEQMRLAAIARGGATSASTEHRLVLRPAARPTIGSSAQPSR